MARKGNQAKRRIDPTLSKSKKKDPDLMVLADELVGKAQDGSHLTEGVNGTAFPRDGRKKKKRSGDPQGNDEQKVDAMQGIGPSVHDGMEDFGARDFNRAHVRNRSSESLNGTFGHTANGSCTDARTSKMQFSHVVALERLRTSALSILRTSYGWLGRQKPFFIAVANNIHRARDYIGLNLVQAYPIILKSLFHLGNFMLLLSVVWLGCAVRGMDSFLRMGTTSFFSVLWFSILSVIAMIGMFKFLLLLAVAALIGILMGFMISLLVIAASGAIFLWFYGSFWTTSIIITLAGLAFVLGRERLALLITTVYSVYCAWTYVGWLGLLLGLNLSFISSDALIYFLKDNIDERRNKASERADRFQDERSFFNGEAHHSYSDIGAAQSSDRSTGVTSTSGADSEITSEEEVVRLLNCRDHYSALGLSRYQQVDVSLLKREYRKKAMLVHPDKNMGNEMAAEAFMKLQNAYEVLLDSLKQKSYDDELRREELLNYFCRFQSTSQKNGLHGFFRNGFGRSEGDGEDPIGEPRRIACKKCGGFHIWLQTKKSKVKARWCQDCKDFHQAKDGDGWVEQSSQPLLFGILQKVDVPVAYVCADSIVYNATEWYICQGMRCAANSHKPSFHVNTSVTKNNNGKGSTSSHRGGGASAPNMEGNMTEEEFFEWLHNAMQLGMFDNFGGGTSSETPQTSARNAPKSGPNTGSGTSSGKKRKKGKKQW